MQATYRLLVCRLGFLLLCLLPTLAVCAACLYRATPWYAHRAALAWEQAIEEQLGLIAEVDRVVREGNARCLLQGVQIFDSESRARLVRIRTLAVEDTPGGTVLRASQTEVEPQRLGLLHRVLLQRVLRTTNRQLPLHFSASEVTLLGESARTLVEVEASVEADPTATRGLAEFRVAGVEMTRPARLQVERNAQTAPASVSWRLETNVALPCSLLADVVGGLNRLGARCQFRGVATADDRSDGWSGEIVGSFTAVELDRLLQPFPHRIRGLATVDLRRVRFRSGRIVSAAGQLRSDGGVVATSLVESLGRALALDDRLTTRQRAAPLHRYTSLAVGFELNRGSLLVTGLCDSPERGILLQSAAGPLLTGTSTTSPAVSLTRALSPGDHLVPATREVGLLLRVLPPLERSAGTVRLGGRPSTRLRLQTERQ